MAYTDIDKPSDYFNTVLRSGLYGGSDTAFTVGFQPDWIWDKRRSGTSVHALFDSVRGFGSSGKVLYSNTNGAEATNGLIDSVNSTGFTIKASADNTGTLVDWCWKAGTSFTNDASSTGIGTIDSTGSVSTDAGFSIVTFTGNSGSIAHGLAQKPAMVIIKPRNVSGSWIVTHKGLGAEMQDYYLFLDTTAAKATSNNIWGGEPTSTTFSVSSSLIDSANYVVYCFAEKKGYSKFGSYTGNGNADGTFVYTGFRPAWIMVKKTNAAHNWTILDTKRNPINDAELALEANLSNAEGSGNNMDILSNGFKFRATGEWGNGSGGSYIYMAFAENPFVTGASAIPTTAR